MKDLWPDPAKEFKRQIDVEVRRIAQQALFEVDNLQAAIKVWQGDNPMEAHFFTPDSLVPLMQLRRNLCETLYRVKKPASKG